MASLRVLLISAQFTGVDNPSIHEDLRTTLGGSEQPSHLA